MNLADQIEQILNIRPSRVQSMQGGMIGDVYQVTLLDNDRIVAKVARGKNATLDIEGDMLNYLAKHSALPVPDVLHSEQRLLQSQDTSKSYASS